MHAKIAERLKEYELELGTYPGDVVNELRYALRAILEIEQRRMQPDKDEKHLSDLEERAYHALLCAYHDLVDGMVVDLVLVKEHLLGRKYYEATYFVLGQKVIDIRHTADTG